MLIDCLTAGSVAGMVAVAMCRVRVSGWLWQPRKDTAPRRERQRVARDGPPGILGVMSDESRFIVAMAADPDDDTPRLVFADWLDEHGQHDRAEFIRLQCRPDRDDP